MLQSFRCEGYSVAVNDAGQPLREPRELRYLQVTFVLVSSSSATPVSVHCPSSDCFEYACAVSLTRVCRRCRGAIATRRRTRCVRRSRPSLARSLSSACRRARSRTCCACRRGSGVRRAVACVSASCAAVSVTCTEAPLFTVAVCSRRSKQAGVSQPAHVALSVDGAADDEEEDEDDVEDDAAAASAPSSSGVPATSLNARGGGDSSGAQLVFDHALCYVTGSSRGDKIWWEVCRPGLADGDSRTTLRGC